MAEKGPSKGQKSKFRKTFFLMSQGVLCQKIRFLGQKLWPVACKHTHKHTHRHTEVLTTENPIMASAFQASACDLIWAVQ